MLEGIHKMGTPFYPSWHDQEQQQTLFSICKHAICKSFYNKLKSQLKLGHIVFTEKESDTNKNIRFKF